MSRIFIGIPCFKGVDGDILEDYMRFAFSLGRRLPEHEFFLGIRQKMEQFRARNAILEGARQIGCDYLFMLDDDHIIDWEKTSGPNNRYTSLIQTLINHLESDPAMGICGGLYYHRGAECRPVVMKEGKDGGYYWMRDDEITSGLQDVAVTGGGCMMLKLSMFDRITPPYFEPEFQLGTDVQICKKAKDAGFRVCCDTSVKIGHQVHTSQIITPNNRHQVAMDSAQQLAQKEEGLERGYLLDSAIALYRMDAEEYLGMSFEQMGVVAERYNAKDIQDNKDDIVSYYAKRGKEQLARQVIFHHLPYMVRQEDMFLNMVNTAVEKRGLDVGCGSAPISFELALRGHRIDFIDVDGSGAYEFTKWRAKKRGIVDRCGFAWGGPYDYAMMFDSLEHIEDWRGMLDRIIDSLVPNGAIITNYFWNNDYDNPEHISMDKAAVKKHLIGRGVYPINEVLWSKKDLGFMDKKEGAENEHSEKDCVLR